MKNAYLEKMKKIEAIQTEIGVFLSDMMPVPWKMICFYADAAPGTSSIWYAVVEKETDVIISSGPFWRRYESYPFSEDEVTGKLLDLALALYNAYIEIEGEEKVWRSMYYSLKSDGKIQIDFEFDLPDGNLIEQQNAVYKRFFNCERKKSPKGKYPSKE